VIAHSAAARIAQVSPRTSRSMNRPMLDAERETSPREAPNSCRRHAAPLVVLAVLLLTYSLTATWTGPYHGDAYTNAVTGWYLAETGSVIATDHGALTTPEQHGNFSWFVASPRGPISQYPPGAAALAAVFYLFDSREAPISYLSGTNRPDLEPVPLPSPSTWPATASAVFATALAGAIVTRVVSNLGATSRQAIVTGLTWGLATTAWSVASNMSWTHGPAMLCISLAMLAASRDRWLLTGLSLGLAILVRPHLALIALVVGCLVGFRRRDWRPLVGVGFGSFLGLAGLLTYNFWVWGRLTISGGYGSSFSERFVGGSLEWFAGNVVGALIDFDHGVLPWAPFLVVLVAAAVMSNRESPVWSTAFAIGGALYLLVQLRANRFSGGDGHFAYRYPLETLTAAAPWLFVGYRRWVRERPVMNMAVIATVLLAAVAQAWAALQT